MAYDVFDADELLYPCSDGEPMAENQEQANAIIYMTIGLEQVFAGRPDVLVGTDFFWYPVEGQPTIVVAPDVAVIEGIDVDTFESYRPWRYGGRLTLAVEIWSPSNRSADKQAKLAFYDRYGVDEYWTFDPRRGQLRVWERQAGASGLVEVVTLETWRSTVCGCQPAVQGKKLVVFDHNGTPWPTKAERAVLHSENLANKQRADSAEQRADSEQQRADSAEQRADSAEARLREVEAEFARRFGQN